MTCNHLETSSRVLPAEECGTCVLLGFQRDDTTSVEKMLTAARLSVRMIIAPTEGNVQLVEYVKTIPSLK